MRNAECKDETVEGNLSPRIDRAEKLHRGLLPPALALHDRLGPFPEPFLEAEDVGRFLQQPVIEELLHSFLAEPLDVESIPRCKMAQTLDCLSRTGKRVHTAPGGFGLTRLGVHFADRMAAADGASVGHLIGLRLLGP